MPPTSSGASRRTMIAAPLPADYARAACLAGGMLATLRGGDQPQRGGVEVQWTDLVDWTAVPPGYRPGGVDIGALQAWRPPRPLRTLPVWLRCLTSQHEPERATTAQMASSCSRAWADLDAARAPRTLGAQPACVQAGEVRPTGLVNGTVSGGSGERVPAPRNTVRALPQEPVGPGRTATHRPDADLAPMVSRALKLWPSSGWLAAFQ